VKRSTTDALPRGLQPGLCLTRYALCLLLLASAPAPAQVPDAAWYEVEVIVFRNRSLQADGEQWPVREPLPEAGISRAAVGSDLQELAPGEYALDNIASALQRSGSYEVLLHKAWREPAGDRNTAIPYPVPHSRDGAGNVLGGTIRLVRERFLHLDVDITAGPSQTVSDRDGTSAGPYFDAPVYRLNQARRVRSGELHYFDHPYFGVIAQVVPYSPPLPELPVPVGTVRMENSDPRVVGEEPTPVGETRNVPAADPR
jgi:hypothetical protein